MTNRILMALLFLCAFPLISAAEVPEQLGRDLGQVPGYVVMAVGEEYLIDLDASKGISKGDMFAVVQKGEHVFHPVTHEVIGVLDEIKGFLQITRVKSGYSYAKLLQPAQSPISKGDEISRFYRIPTRFQPETAEQQATHAELKKNLPWLDWLSADSEVKPLLTFQQLTGRLVVETKPGTVLFTYPFAAQTPAKVKVQAKAVVVSPQVPALSTALMPSSAIVPPVISEVGGVWNSPAFDEVTVAMSVGDFDGDGQQEIALVLGKTLKIVRNVQGELTELASLSIGTGFMPLALDSIDLDGNGRSELLLTVLRERTTTLASQLIEFEQGKYQTTILDIPWFLRAVEIPGEGTVLLGQRMLDKQNPFAESLFRVQRNGNQLIEGPFLSLPQHVGLYGFTPFLDEKGQLLYAYLSASDYLKVVTAEGKILWESPDKYGGSEISFNMPPEASSDDPIVAYIKARIVTAQGSFFVPQNDGFRFVQGFRMFQKSRMVNLTWNGLTMNEAWKTADQSGYLNDIALADMDNDGQVELLTFIKFKHKGMFQKARSALVAYELN